MTGRQKGGEEKGRAGQAPEGGLLTSPRMLADERAVIRIAINHTSSGLDSHGNATPRIRPALPAAEDKRNHEMRKDLRKSHRRDQTLIPTHIKS